ncbi:hypothetical protein HD554DRAFT_873416 [Boletus coccyginus]|nr:hypothetical protein HD554DRAFT_873416 [Boletus coccyginus]
MATPPMAKISMIGIWVETVFYGVNCVLYALCVLVLLRPRGASKVPTLRWVLIVMSTIHFLLATVHVGASLQQLLEAFVYAPVDVPDYSTTYWLDYTTTLSSLKDILYNTLVFTQDFILIWRLYVVFMYDWRVLVFPIILEAASMGVIYPAAVLIAHPSIGLYGSVVPALVISAWVLNITLNVSVTMAIAGRLWWMGRTIASLTSTRSNRYAFSIYVTVESGAIFTGANIILLLLYVSNNPGLLAGLNVTSQLATLTPLLIVVQVGLTDQYHFPRGDSYSRTVPIDEIAFRVETPRGSQQDISLHTTLSRFPSSADSAHVW